MADFFNPAQNPHPDMVRLTEGADAVSPFPLHPRIQPHASLAVVSHSVTRSERPPVVRWQKLRSGSEHNSIPGIQGMSSLPLHDISHPHSRPAVRAAKRINRLGAFFGDGRPDSGETVLTMQSGGNLETVLFVEAQFTRRRHYLHLRGAKRLPGTVSDAAAVNVLTGICMFSNQTVRFIDENDNSIFMMRPVCECPTYRLRRIAVATELSLYEYETMARQSRVVADIVAALPANLALSVTIDIPRVQYYFIMLGAYEQGLASDELILEWFHLVDSRHALVSRLFRENLARELTMVGRPDVSVRISQGLNCLEGALREITKTGVMPRQNTLLGALVAEDPIWNLLLNNIQPENHSEICEASYVAEVLRAVGLHQSGTRYLGVLVDNYSEYPIYVQAQKVLKNFSDCAGAAQLLSIYPAERLLNVTHDGHRHFLYTHDPGRYAIDENNLEIDLFSVVDSLYS